jgi:AcrR family transcriptional regulator
MKETSVSTPPASSRARATYGQLLDAAEGLLAGGGFEAMTSTAVAGAAGVSTGTFYTYFPDKHAVLAALFARCLDDLVARVAAVLTADRLLDDGLDATVAAVVDLVVAGYRDAGPVLRAALARVPVRDDLRAVYWQRHAQATEAVTRFLRRGAAAGLVRRDDHPAVAQAVLLLVQGLNHPVLTDGRRRPGASARAVRAQLARALVGLLAAAGQTVPPASPPPAVSQERGV